MFADNPLDSILRPRSADAALSERLSLLERRDRAAWAERPAFPEILTGAGLRHIEALGRFWPEPPDPSGLEMMGSRIQALLNGFAASQSPCVFLVKGHERQLSIYLGADAGADELVEILLGAHFPGVRTATVSTGEALLHVQRLPYCHLLAGVPSSPHNDDEKPAVVGQMDRLVRGLLYGGSWALVVLAYPLSVTEGGTLVDRWSEMVEQARMEFQQPGTTGEFSRLGELYVDLLEVQLERALLGRTQGNWLAQTYLLSESPAAAALAIAALAGEESRPEPLRALPCEGEMESSDHLVMQATWLNSCDLTNIIQFPLREYPGYSVETIARFDVNAPDPARGEPTIQLGWIQDLGIPTGHAFGLEIDRLIAHVLVAGTTDSGKTNTTFHILDELHKQEIPFLVIEPTKGEYRFLKSAFPELRVVTLGSNEAPLRVNPFYVPRGVPVQTHLDYLLSLFAASFVLYAPMPYVLESALHEVYADKGWDLANDRCARDPHRPERAFPTLTDLYHKTDEVVDRLGYDTRINRDVKAALHARLNSLRVGNKGAMLDTRVALDVKELLDGPVVIEMNAIGDDEQKAFFIGLILMMLYEHCWTEGIQLGEVKLRHVTIIEEAHRLLQNVSQEQSPDFANPRGKAVQTFSNIIAEIRAYGEGFIIVEQSPVKLAPDVLKNTNLKLIHRIISGDDREAMAGAIPLNERQQEVLVGLPRGYAVAFTSGMDGPVLLRVPEAKTRLIEPEVGLRLRAQPDDREHGIWGSLPLAEEDERRVRIGFARWLLSSVFGDEEQDRRARATLLALMRSVAPVALRTPTMEEEILQGAIPRLADWLVTCVGKFYNWPFADEEHAQRAIERLWKERSVPTDLQRLLTDGTTVAIRPFDACRVCPAPCRFRFFAALIVDDPDRQPETRQVLESYAGRPTADSIRQLALHGRLLSKWLVEPGVATVSAGAGLCTLILAAHRLGWPGSVVAGMAGAVWPQLG